MVRNAWLVQATLRYLVLRHELQVSKIIMSVVTGQAITNLLILTTNNLNRRAYCPTSDLLYAKIGAIAWRHPAVPVHHLTFFFTLSYNNFLNIRDIKDIYIEKLLYFIISILFIYKSFLYLLYLKS